VLRGFRLRILTKKLVLRLSLIEVSAHFIRLEGLSPAQVLRRLMFSILNVIAEPASLGGSHGLRAESSLDLVGQETALRFISSVIIHLELTLTVKGATSS
jgi:hypothetical protein